MADRTETEIPTSKLLEAALLESRELIKIEIELAKLEAKKQVRAALAAAIGFALAAFLAMTAVALLLVGLVLLLGGTAASAFGVALGALVLAVLVALGSFAAIPKKPLSRSRQHVGDDLKLLKEHAA